MSALHYTCTCACGEVEFEARRAPILTAACFCDSCRLAARQFEQAPGAPSVLNREGGVDYSLFRKDRVAVVRGSLLLRSHKLAETSPTRRVVATCCNAPMFLDFTPGHWLSLYRDRLSHDAPPVEIAVMTGDLPAEHPRPRGLRTHSTRPPRFMIKLLASFVGMGFRQKESEWR